MYYIKDIAIIIYGTLLAKKNVSLLLRSYVIIYWKMYGNFGRQVIKDAYGIEIIWVQSLDSRDMFSMAG